MVEFLKQASRYGFGEQSGQGVVANPLTHWLGTQRNEMAWPMPEYEIERFIGGAGGLDAYQQAVKQAKLDGSFSVLVQNGWLFKWALGAATDVAGTGVGGNGATVGKTIHQVRGANARVFATLQQVLGDGTGTEFAINWLDALVDKLTARVEENGQLETEGDYKCLSYDDTATPVAVTAGAQSPFLWSQATWQFCNPGASDLTTGTQVAFTGLTQPEALVKWDYTLQNKLNEIRGHRTTNPRFPVTNVKGDREHELNVTIVPSDLTFFRLLVKGAAKFDLVYRLTRAAAPNDDLIEFRWRDCYVKKAPHNFPQQNQHIPVDVSIQPRFTEIDVVDANATLLAGA